MKRKGTVCAANITCRATAKEKIGKVLLWHKPLSPCDARWKSVEMTRGEGDTFAAQAHIGMRKKEAGLMYSFEVIDGAGQVRRFPDPLLETPYRIVELEEEAAFMTGKETKP